MKTAFFIDSAKLNRQWSIDIRKQALSGTDSLLIQVARFITIEQKQGVIFCTSDPIEGVDDDIQLVENLVEAIHFASIQDCNRIVFICLSTQEQLALLADSSPTGVSLTPWLQNTPSLDYLDVASECKQLHNMICVSNVQAFSMVDHPIYKKLLVIPNFVDVDFWKSEERTEKDIVTYVGALKESKGFHHLADAWGEVNKIHSDWQLHVCGGPGLYGHHSELGVEKIAEESFEKRILSPLGGTRDSAAKTGVKFLGSLNKESLRSQLAASSIVVVNPNTTGSIETFCVSAVEAEAMGLPVIGGAAGGLLETIGHEEAGLLCESTVELTQSILTLISDHKKRHLYGEIGQRKAEDNFSAQVVLKKWELFCRGEFNSLTPTGEKYKPKHYYLRLLLSKCLPPKTMMKIKKAVRKQSQLMRRS